MLLIARYGSAADVEHLEETVVETLSLALLVCWQRCGVYPAWSPDPVGSGLEHGSESAEVRLASWARKITALRGSQRPGFSYEAEPGRGVT